MISLFQRSEGGCKAGAAVNVGGWPRAEERGDTDRKREESGGGELEGPWLSIPRGPVRERNLFELEGPWLSVPRGPVRERNLFELEGPWLSVPHGLRGKEIRSSFSFFYPTRHVERGLTPTINLLFWHLRRDTELI